MLAPETLEEITAAVKAANRYGEPLRIFGSDSKAFYGRGVVGTPLSLRNLSGVIAYEPTELVVTVRAGTRIGDLEALLASKSQMLACEPPHLGNDATIGGMIGTGLAGPRRPYAGGVRDSVLGIRCIVAAGSLLRFGGQVMKNVAGFDISRLMVGALGTLGIIVEASLKVLPRPRAEITLCQEVQAARAIELMNAWARKPLPLSAAAYDGVAVYARLTGSAASVASACAEIGGHEADSRFWEDLREQRLPYFLDGRPVWRISAPPAAAPLALAGEWFFDWGGAHRWLKSEADPEDIKHAAVGCGGHAVLFRGGDQEGEPFPRPPPALLSVYQRIKKAFDPNGILNPGRLLPEL